MYKKLIGFSLFIILFDQIVKLLVRSNMVLNTSISVIPDFFSISYVQNEGGAWSLFSGSTVLFILTALFSLIFLYVFFIHKKKLVLIEIITYSLLFGGIIGNLVDRILFGYVIDYFDFTFFGYHFPVFNIADICIVISVIFLIFTIWKGEKICKKSL